MSKLYLGFQPSFLGRTLKLAIVCASLLFVRPIDAGFCMTGENDNVPTLNLAPLALKALSCRPSGSRGAQQRGRSAGTRIAWTARGPNLWYYYQTGARGVTVDSFFWDCGGLQKVAQWRIGIILSLNGQG